MIGTPLVLLPSASMPSEQEAELKLELLVEGARQARLYLAKEQLEL